MKLLVSLICVAMPIASLGAQDLPDSSRFEIRGIGSYSYGMSKAPPYPGMPTYAVYDREQAVSFTPGCGLFACDEIELLFDLQYAFSYSDNSSFGSLYQSNFWRRFWKHRLGVDCGASFNLWVNPVVVPFIGVKIGTRWSRIIQGDRGSDSGWGRREIVFPDIVLGARAVLGKNWTVMMQLEYAETSPSDFISPYDDYWDTRQSFSFGIGFSVFP